MGNCIGVSSVSRASSLNDEVIPLTAENNRVVEVTILAKEVERTEDAGTEDAGIILLKRQPLHVS